MSVKETSELLKNNKINNMGSISLRKPRVLPLHDEFKIYHILHFIYASILYSFTNYFQQSIAPITDVLQTELNVKSSGIGFLSASYFIVYCTMQLPFGVILQHFSHHMILLWVAIGLFISWTIFGFINSFTFALIIRILSGLCGAPAWIIVITLAGDYFGNNKVAYLSGFTTLLTCGLIPVLFTLQAYMYEKYHIWREIYYGIGVIGFLNVLAIIFTIYCQRQQIKRKKKKIVTRTDASWINLFSASTTLLLDDEPKQQTLTCKKLQIVVSNYLNWCLGLWGFAVFGVMSSIFGLWLVPYLMIKFGYSRTLSSFYAGIGSLSIGFGSTFFGYLIAKYKKRKIFLMMQILLVSTFAFLLYLDKDILNEYVVFIILVLCGFGLTCCSLYPLVREYNGKHETEETATGFVSGVNSLGGLVISYVIGILIDYHSTEIQYTVDDYEFAFSCVMLMCWVILVITTFLLKETNGKNLI